jgi:putative transposase
MQLKTGDAKKLEAILRAGVQPVRTVRRAWILQQLGQGESGLRVAAKVGVAVNTVYQVRRRYQEEGLERALYDRPRPGAKPILDTRQKQRIIAMVCSGPPPGYARWSVRLIAAEAKKRKLVKQVGRESIRILLVSHDLKPWREKNVVYCRVE